MDVIKLQIHHAYTCWEHYTFPASELQDSCLFTDSVISLIYTGHSKCCNDQYRDIGKQLSTAGDPGTQAIQGLWVSLVYKCPLLTRINKTNGSNRQFDGHGGWQVHIFWRSICHTRSSHTWAKQTGTGNNMVIDPADLWTAHFNLVIITQCSWGLGSKQAGTSSLLAFYTYTFGLSEFACVANFSLI